MRQLVAMVVCLAMATAVTWVQPAPAQPTTAPAAQSQPASRPTSAPTPEMQILNRLEKAGDKFPAVTAKLTYVFRDRLVGDAEIRTGTVSYLRGKEKSPARFQVDFRTLQTSPKVKPLAHRQVYAFDGMWLSVLKYLPKQITRYQVARKGQRVEPLRIGRGPFPLPFGQKAADVLKYFVPTTKKVSLRVGTVPKAPANADYIGLIRRTSRADEMKYALLEMWVDRKTDLPVLLIAYEGKRLSRRGVTKVTSVQFTDVQTSEKLPESVFYPRKPIGWKERIEPLRGATQTAPNAPRK